MEDDGDDALDALDHDALVSLLDRLYASAGESRMSRSTARASSDDELRDAVRSVRRRMTGQRASDAPWPTSAASVRGTPSPRGERRRWFCVLYTMDSGLLAQARAVLRSCGVPVVAVAESADLAALAANAMPSHLVVDERCVREIDVGQVLGPRANEVSVAYCADMRSLRAAVAAIATSRSELDP